jgi:predicted transcriptional regulator
MARSTDTRHGKPRPGCSKVSWVIPDDIIQALRRLAAGERRTVSSYAEEALRTYLNARGVKT